MNPLSKYLVIRSRLTQGGPSGRTSRDRSLESLARFPRCEALARVSNSVSETLKR